MNAIDHEVDFGSISLFSADDHLIEPPNVWWDRLPAKYREAGPHVVDEADRSYWAFEDQRVETMGLNAVAGKPVEEWRNDPIRYSDMHPACYDSKVRAELLAGAGIVGSVCFPTLPKFGGARFLEFRDKELALLCVRAYNDWVIEEWCAASPVFVPLTIVPLWDPAEAAEEVRRCAALGSRTVAFPDNPAPLGLPSFYTRHWDPLFDAVTECDLPVSLHILSSGYHHDPSPESQKDVHVMLAQTSAATSMVNLMASPLLDYFPKLQFVLSEGGIGWIPAQLERADRAHKKHHFEKIHGWTRTASEIFSQHFYGVFFEDRVGIENRARIGVDRIMWECDYPHSDASWPNPRGAFADDLFGIPADEVHKIAELNARRLFKWPAKAASRSDHGPSFSAAS